MHVDLPTVTNPRVRHDRVGEARGLPGYGRLRLVDGSRWPGQSRSDTAAHDAVEAPPEHAFGVFVRDQEEYHDGLLRQYFPKGTDLRQHTRADLEAVTTELNDRPRETLGWDTPAERFAAPLNLTQH